MLSTGTIRRKLGILWVLYFVQGLPFGFQATALPVYLRDAGMSLTLIGFATALSLPWMLKPFWAPVVDRYASERFGRRRSWIIPMQGGLLVACLAAGFLRPGTDLHIGNGTTGDGFIGSMDSLEIHNRTLDAGQLLALD